MAVKFENNKAPYRFLDECTWCTANSAGTLSSTGFGSCVGMALFSPVHRIGVVAHFAGALGNRKKYGNHAETDTLEILRDVCPVQPGIWKAWVFGGASISKDTDLIASTVEDTEGLIDTVRQTLKTNPYIPFNLLHNNKEWQEMEMSLAQGKPYSSHKSVKLILETGKVQWG